MTKALIYALFVLLPSLAGAADSALLSMVMPDAKVLSGVQVDSARNSAFGRFVLSHMQLDDDNFKRSLSDAGFDPRRDLTEILMASNWSDANSRWLLLARGSFNIPKFTTAFATAGGTTATFLGVNIFSGKPADSVVAFLDAGVAAMGDLDSVKGAIQRYQQHGSKPGSALIARVASLSAAHDFWFITLVPVTEFAGAVPDPNLSQAMQGGMLQGITEASGGVKFGDVVQFSVQALTRTEKDAASLLEVVHFLSGLLKMNREKDVAASQIGSLIDSLEAKARGNVVTLTLAVTEAQLDQIMNTAKQENKPPAAKQ